MELVGKSLAESFADLWSTFVHLANFKETVCVIDALDECRERDRNELIKSITTFFTGSVQNCNLKFIITSRPYAHISRQFVQGLGSLMSLIHLQGDSGPTADDITTEIKFLVDSRIKETAQSFNLTLEEHNLLEERMNAVENRTYLWVTLLFDGLMDDKRQVSFDADDIMNLTKTLPKSVDDAYQKILSKSADPEKARRIIHIVLGAIEPLSVAEMSVALAVNISDSAQASASDMNKVRPVANLRVDIRNLCGLFVTIVDDKVYLLHQTAREFLMRPESKQVSCTLNSRETSSHALARKDAGESYVWKHSATSTEVNAVMAEICIRYLHSELVMDVISLLQYSSRYWAIHYNQSNVGCREILSKMTQQLCLVSEKRTRWMQHYGGIRIPKVGHPLCLAAALGLERAVHMILDEQATNIGGLVNIIDSEAKLRLYTTVVGSQKRPRGCRQAATRRQR